MYKYLHLYRHVNHRRRIHNHYYDYYYYYNHFIIVSSSHPYISGTRPKNFAPLRTDCILTPSVVLCVWGSVCTA